MQGLTQDKAAQKARLSRRRIGQLVASGSLKTRENGRIDEEHFAAWLKERNAAKAPKPQPANGTDKQPGTVSGNLTEARRREVDLKADKLALDLAEKAGSLVLASEVQAGYADIYARVRSHAAAWKAKIPSALGVKGKDRPAAMLKLDALERDFLLAISATDDEDDDS